MVFLIQLILNVLWSYLFFGLRSPFLGVIGITILWFAIVLTVVFFFRISRTAGLILLPYLGWVSFAGYLNYLIFALNTYPGGNHTHLVFNSAAMLASFSGRMSYSALWDSMACLN